MDKKYFWRFYLKPNDKFEWIYASILLSGLIIVVIGFYILYHRVYLPKLEKHKQEQKTLKTEDIRQR